MKSEYPDAAKFGRTASTSATTVDSLEGSSAGSGSEDSAVNKTRPCRPVLAPIASSEGAAKDEIAHMRATLSQSSSSTSSWGIDSLREATTTGTLTIERLQQLQANIQASTSHAEQVRKADDKGAVNGVELAEEEEDREDESDGDESSAGVQQEQDGKKFVPVPLESRTPQWSNGAQKHATDECSPCVWFWKVRGCCNEGSCDFCHMCPPGMVKQRKQEKIRRLKMERREQRLKLQKARQEQRKAAAQRTATLSGTAVSSAAPYKPGPISEVPRQLPQDFHPMCDEQVQFRHMQRHLEPYLAGARGVQPQMQPYMTQSSVMSDMQMHNARTFMRPTEAASEKLQSAAHPVDVTCEAVRLVLADRGVELSRGEILAWLAQQTGPDACRLGAPAVHAPPPPSAHLQSAAAAAAVRAPPGLPRPAAIVFSL